MTKALGASVIESMKYHIDIAERMRFLNQDEINTLVFDNHAVFVRCFEALFKGCALDVDRMRGNAPKQNAIETLGSLKAHLTGEHLETLLARMKSDGAANLQHHRERFADIFRQGVAQLVDQATHIVVDDIQARAARGKAGRQ